MKKIATRLILLGCLSSSLYTMDFPELHAAARAGDIAKVRSLLDSGANPNSKNTWAWTPLHQAASCGQHDVAALLLKRGATVQAKNNFEETPLHCASTYGHDELVELILHYGADPNDNKNVGWSTPLHKASENGNLGTAKLLLDHGADPNNSNEGGNTPLSYAANKGHYDVVKLLLDRGAVMEQSGWDRTPLSRPTQYNQTRFVELLLVADPPKPKALPRRFPFFCLNTIPPKEELLYASQDRITALRCLCSFTKARCQSGLFSYLFKEQPLSPLPRLPLHLQDLIISYLPEDVYSPRLLARMLNNLHTSHPERVGDLVTHHPRTLFVSAFQKTSNEAMKRAVFAEIKKHVMHRASDVCEAEDGVQKRHPDRYPQIQSPNRLQQLIQPDDPYEVRATFIHQQLKYEFEKKTE